MTEVPIKNFVFMKWTFCERKTHEFGGSRSTNLFFPKSTITLSKPKSWFQIELTKSELTWSQYFFFGLLCIPAKRNT